MSDRGWWVIHGETLLELLRRCHAGEDPDLVYNDALTDVTIEDVEPDKED